MYRDLFEKLVTQPQPEFSMSQDSFDLLKGIGDHKLTPKLTLSLQKELTRLVEIQNFDLARQYKDLYYRVVKWDAPVNFESFLIAMEFDREADRRYYLPRKNVLKPMVDDIQTLMDGELDELFLSLPPRTGKTGLSTFYVAWLLGRDPELSNLYISYTASVAQAFYDGILEVINDKYTYNWQDIFPDAPLVMTNAKDATLDISRKKKYHSFTARSLYGTLNGALDVTGVLILDDLLSGYEEAINPDRLITAWGLVDNNAITRAKLSAKLFWIGTRWSMADPIGRRIDMLDNNPFFKNHRYKIYNIPALNENDESNFEYQYNLGFTTDYFRQRRASFEANNDAASFFAQYQGEPIEREGSLFSVDDFHYFNGELPDKPDRIYIVCDPAFGGGDFTACSICYQYGEDVYIPDVIYSNLDKSYTIPMIVKRVENYGVQLVRVEATKTTKSYSEGIEKELEVQGFHTVVTNVPAPSTTSKAERIWTTSADIKKHFYFLNNTHWTKEYAQFMANVFSYKIIGKNKHDDAPDCLAQTVSEAFKRKAAKAEVFARPF
jgi:predicted phage terminase large subunit-like protein